MSQAQGRLQGAVNMLHNGERLLLKIDRSKTHQTVTFPNNKLRSFQLETRRKQCESLHGYNSPISSSLKHSTTGVV